MSFEARTEERARPLSSSLTRIQHLITLQDFTRLDIRQTDDGGFKRLRHATDPDDDDDDRRRSTTIDDDRRRDDDDVDEHGAEIFEILDRVDAINLVQKSSKSELSSRFFGRSKFFGCKKVEFLNGRLPTEDGSVRPQTLGKRVSDDARHFIFRC